VSVIPHTGNTHMARKIMNKLFYTYILSMCMFLKIIIMKEGK
jgi:hypothetical protein